LEQANIKIIVRNRKAHFEYEIIQSFEAGIVLHGTEVKSLRAGKCNLTDGFVEIVSGEAWLKSVHISEYYTRKHK
jgi:SsrA-binding protein